MAEQFDRGKAIADRLDQMGPSQGISSRHPNVALLFHQHNVSRTRFSNTATRTLNFSSDKLYLTISQTQHPQWWSGRFLLYRHPRFQFLSEAIDIDEHSDGSHLLARRFVLGDVGSLDEKTSAVRHGVDPGMSRGSDHCSIRRNW